MCCVIACRVVEFGAVSSAMVSRAHPLPSPDAPKAEQMMSRPSTHFGGPRCRQSSRTE